MSLCVETGNVNGILVRKFLSSLSLERRRIQYEDAVGWSLRIKTARARPDADRSALGSYPKAGFVP